ncbi:MAG: polyphenol oxidase family protein [Eubacteriales bacterium]|nr:polyphenol oxidase family protein [Eubacteriales bacterium]
MLEIRELRSEVLQVNEDGQEGRLFTFPELKEQGFDYLLTSRDFDTAIHPGKKQTAPWQAIKDFFGQDQHGHEKQLIILRQTHSSRIIELNGRQQPEELASFRDLSSLEGEAGHLAEVIENEAKETIEAAEVGLEIKPLDFDAMGEEGKIAAEQLGFALRYAAIDGLLSNSCELILGTTHADCAPVIFFDRRQKLLVNIHSGWRGTLALFPLRTLEYLTSAYGVQVDDLTVVLGPMIAGVDYEVEADVAVPCMAVFPEEARVIEQKSDFKYKLDLKAAISWQLGECGLKTGSVYTVPGSTYQSENYHSYRRDGSANYGLMSSFASLNCQ